MQITAGLVNYWNFCRQAVEHISLTNIEQSFIITEAEVAQAKISNQQMLAQLFSACSHNQSVASYGKASDEQRLVLIAPYRAVAAAENLAKQLYLIFYYAILTKTGELTPFGLQPMPWLGAAIVEPSQDTVLTLAYRDQAERAYQLLPEPWLDEAGALTCQQQLDYARAYFSIAAHEYWETALIEAGYRLCHDISIIPLSFRQTNNYINNNDHNSHNNHNNQSINSTSKLWQRLVNIDISDPEWNGALALDDDAELELDQSCDLDPAVDQPLDPELDQGFAHDYEHANLLTAHVGKGFALSAAQRNILLRGLSLPAQQSMFIAAGPGTGKTTVINDLVASLWVNALLSNAEPPVVIALEYKTSQLDNKLRLYTRQLTIMDCLPVEQRWLADYQQSLFTSTNKEALSAQKATIIAEFLAKCAGELGEKLVDLANAKQALLTRIMQLEENLQAGIAAALGVAKLNKQFALSYSAHGGIKQRAADIQQQLTRQQEYHRHLQVLQAWWERQVADIPKLIQTISAFLPAKQHTLKQLYNFFAEYFPEEDIRGCNIAQMTQRIHELLLKSEKKQQVLADAYLQVEADLRQVEIVEHKSQLWLRQNIGRIVDLPEIFAFLDQRLCYRILLLAAHYWEADLLQNAALSAATFNYTQSIIDYLIIENSENFPPVLADICFTTGERLIAFGETVVNKSCQEFSHTIDTKLLAGFGLLGQSGSASTNLADISNELDDTRLDNLEFCGLTMAKGNLAVMLKYLADQRGAPYYLPTQWDSSLSITQAYNAIYSSYGANLKSELQDNQHNSQFNLAELVNINAISCRPIYAHAEAYLGSRINQAEISAIVTWLKQQETNLRVAFNMKSLTKVVAIYTTFYGQWLALKAALTAANLTIATVALLDLAISSACERKELVIFSPVYSRVDKGNLAFDAGAEKLGTLLKLTKQHLLIFADDKIFDTKLHSPSGKLAKYLVIDDMVAEPNLELTFSYTQ